jgi:hypothetical protein
MYLNDTPYAPISYEDVDVGIQNLIDLGLIQNVKNFDNKNNKKSIEDYNSIIKESQNKIKISPIIQHHLQEYFISSQQIQRSLI